MANPFGTAVMAGGYAHRRPPVHARILEKARPHLRPAHRALDLGCGSGLSTKVLENFARTIIALDPVETMVQLGPSIAPGAFFLAGRAEELPFRDASIDLITAAGSLNYAGVQRFFPEARRVLASDGQILVYDFSAGRSFTTGPELDRWFDQFRLRYPTPPNEALALDPQKLAAIAAGFRLTAHEDLEIPLILDHDFYLSYILTETNVAAAIRSGESEYTIRDWCERSLHSFWASGSREVVFRGYFAVLS